MGDWWTAFGKALFELLLPGSKIRADVFGRLLVIILFSPLAFLDWIHSFPGASRFTP